MPKLLAEKSGFEEDVIRELFFSKPLENKINEIKDEKIVVSKEISEIEGSDNYILIIEDINTTFEVIGELMSISIPHKEYENIPLEIAIDYKEVTDSNLEPINRTQIIEFLKNDIINPYRNCYKKQYGESIKDTFILVTKKIVDELDPLDKESCREVPYRDSVLVFDKDSFKERYEVLNFLKLIDVPESGIYNRINELYVFPNEYLEIREFFEDNNILILTGTAEYGKTYTAIRLLWEFYKKGYNPNWAKGSDEKENNEAGKRLEDIKKELKSKTILYFEDPFGKREYQSRDALEREISIILSEIKNAIDVYIIITSRGEIFEMFRKECISPDEIQAFEKKLTVKGSYDFEKRKEIVIKWAESKDCKWLNYRDLKDLVFKSIKDEKNLPTPLSIKEFIFKTINVTEKNKLIEELENNSKGMGWSFAKEIEHMTHDKIVFLSFPLISNFFPLNIVEDNYEKIVTELRISKFEDINDIISLFKSKLDISTDGVRFSHESYKDALKYLIKKGYFKEIFCTVLLKLSENKDTVPILASSLHSIFYLLPEDVRNVLLINLAGSGLKAVTWNVAFFIGTNRSKLIDKIPKEAWKKLLINLAGAKDNESPIIIGKILPQLVLYHQILDVEEFFDLFYEIISINEEYADDIIIFAKKLPASIKFPEALVNKTKSAIEEELNRLQHVEIFDWDKEEIQLMISRFEHVIDKELISRISLKL